MRIGGRRCPRTHDEAALKVLCIDDEASNQAVIRDMLSIAGAQTIEAADADAGLSLLDHDEPDVVIIDLRMPGVDGIEAVKRIRSRQDAKAAVPIIVATADTGLHVRENCLAAGADEVLQKPLSMQKLFSAIGVVINRRASSTGSR